MIICFYHVVGSPFFTMKKFYINFLLTLFVIFLFCTPLGFMFLLFITFSDRDDKSYQFDSAVNSIMFMSLIIDFLIFKAFIL